ncbi:MAG: hypothetical protein LBM71_01060 [Elusimicrobiota bacterium]|jgi:hypothetical protein|nr:hypothetical protein [Elusimicrobiota bacterium]
MATFKGFLRELDRIQRRSARSAEREHKISLKRQEARNARNAVEEQEEFLSFITTVHKDCSKKINWTEINSKDAPLKPEFNQSNRITAKNNFKNYIPSFFDKIFKLEKYRKRILLGKILKGKKLDSKLFEIKRNNYINRLAEWEAYQRLSKGLLDNNPAVYVECFKSFFDNECLTNLAHELIFKHDGGIVKIKIKSRKMNDFIPQEKLSFTSTGKLSTRAMPISKRNEIYQDYICSIALRIAREIEALFPIDKFLVNIVDDIVNPSTGHLEEQILLSLMPVKDTINKINFEKIDASSCITNFKHNMKFTKTKGLEPIKEVSI